MACDNWLLILQQSYFLLLDPFTGATAILPAPGSVHDIGGGSDSDEDEDSADGDDDSDEGDDDFKDSDQNIYNMKDGKIPTILPTVSWKRGRVLATWLLPQD